MELDFPAPQVARPPGSAAAPPRLTPVCAQRATPLSTPSDLAAGKPRNSSRSGHGSTGNPGPTQIAVNSQGGIHPGNPYRKYSDGPRIANCPLSSCCRSTSAATSKSPLSCDSIGPECFLRCTFRCSERCSNTVRLARGLLRFLHTCSDKYLLARSENSSLPVSSPRETLRATRPNRHAQSSRSNIVMAPS